MEQTVQDSVPVESVDQTTVLSDATPQSESISSNSRGFTKKLLIFGVITFLLAFIATIIFVLQRPKTNNEVVTQTKPTSAPRSKEVASPFPKVHVDNWSFNVATASSVVSSRIINLKSSLTESDFKLFTSKLMNDFDVNTTNQSFVAYPKDGSKTLLYLPKDSNSFIYKSEVGFPVYSTSSAAVLQKNSVEEYIQKLFSDNSLTISATYKKSNTPGVSYFEAHRDWTLLGLPNIQLLSVLNIPESKPLNRLTLSEKALTTQVDDKIIETSDNNDGHPRPNDFNTVTVGVKNGNIVSIASNIRQLAQTPISNISLHTFDEVKEALKSGKSKEVFTAPAGGGSLDTSKIYKDNIANFKNVEIRDAILAYIEEPLNVSQTSLQPYYVVRGYGTLQTGYRAVFIASLPANKSEVLGTYTKSRLLAEYNPSQQQGTLKNPTPTKTPTPTNTPPPPPNNPPPPPSTPTCSPEVSALENTHMVGDVLVGQWGSALTNSRGEQKLWYLVYPQGKLDSSQFDPVLDTILTTYDPRKPGEEGYKDTQNGVECYIHYKDQGTSDGASTKVCESWAIYSQRVLDSLNIYPTSSNGQCPREISISPSLFIYTDKPQTVTISTTPKTTYSDPSFNNSVWSFTANGDTLYQHNYSYPYLYYEYTDIEFNRPHEGWNVQKSELSAFSKQMSYLLKLNSTESERLAFEINQAADQVHAEKLFIGLIPQSEVDAKLPLYIESNPQSVQRVHFYITTNTADKTTVPTVKPITRSVYYVVELGAVAQ